MTASTPATPAAAIYARISKDREGRELGVERQVEACHSLAKQQRLVVRPEHVYVDNDISASTLSTKPRPAYIKMLEAVSQGEVGTVLAYSNSRLTRRPREFLDLIELHRATKVQIKTVASGQHDLSTADGRGAALTVAIWDAAEAERTSERIRAQQAQKALTGGWHGGPPPYGYQAEGKSLVPAPKEVELLHEAADRLLAGDTLYGIHADWNSRGIKTRGTKKRPPSFWRQTNIKMMLLNRSTLGENKAGVKGWEPIIDTETHDRLVALLGDAKRKKVHSPGVRSTKYTMAGGLTVCGKCGHKLISQARNGRHLLRCSSAANGPAACNGLMVEHDLLEEYVFARVVKGLQEDPYWMRRRQEQDPADTQRRKELEQQRASLRTRKGRVNDMFEMGTIDASDLKGRVAQVDAELRQVQDALDALDGSSVISAGLADDLKWQEWSNERRRNFLKLLVGQVVVGPHPPGATGVRPRTGAGETPEQFEERREAWQVEVMDQRVSFG